MADVVYPVSADLSALLGAVVVVAPCSWRFFAGSEGCKGRRFCAAKPATPASTTPPTEDQRALLRGR